MISGFILILLGSFGSTFGPQKSFSVNQSYTLYAISRFLTAVGTRGVSVVGFVLGKIPFFFFFFLNLNIKI